MKEIKDYEYKVDYEIRLFGIEPFSNIGKKIFDFLLDLNKHNLISKSTWIIIDDKKIKYKILKKIFKYLKKKLDDYRSE